MSQCIERHEFDAAELCEAEPPRVTHRNKATLLELAYSKGPASGRLRGSPRRALASMCAPACSPTRNRMPPPSAGT
jgi:hypothetical protein